MADLFSLTGDPLIEAVTAAVRVHMAQYDGSHDFNHIRRVVGLTRHIWHTTRGADVSSSSPQPPADPRVAVLAALLHDVGDRKYIQSAAYAPASDDEAKAIDALVRDTPFAHDTGARATAAVFHRCVQAAAESAGPAVPEPEDAVALGRKVVLVCQNVSWSGENKSDETRAAVARLAKEVPELAMVQDADRLDSLGAVGVARCFAYGARAGVAGKAQGRTLEDSLDHFDEKLLVVGQRMKTAEGARLAAERTQRLRQVQQWFLDEASFAVGGFVAGKDEA
ncbi:uncharacterized protein SPSK_04502 [Sporothrix schenckii 1099-18]|uniref:HD/PDEase domain-containing protein n=2 Tax=Sporothrix schenckii TaxID=29908 RepID=U7PU04_SPOS1|nr:uncharacterized protein SPSK_04502 [Sporothrix schenckii 1099-18]ERS99113.1 hypothetical protein HMPREF1624_04309 [Sporothrix schenckii ATCC 58251]KJR83225.1 hypothetical protein SPSK_04502 [Sporothrix schenckii 1099-18]